MHTILKTKRNYSSILTNKIAIIRQIILKSRAPITSREIARRIMGMGASSDYHMLPAEISAIIRVHLKEQIVTKSMLTAGTTVYHFTPVV